MTFTTFDPGFIEVYQSNWYSVAQQDGSKLLRVAGDVGTQKSKVDHYRRLGKAVTQVKGAKGSDTQYNGVTIDRRLLTLAEYNWADLVSTGDVLRMGGYDPSSALVRQAGKAHGERIDDVIIAALLGAAQTDTGTVALGAGQTVAIDAEVTGTNTGLTIAKLRKAKLKFDAANVPAGNRFAIVTPAALQGLLSDPIVTSSLYNNVQPLVAGEIDSYLGFTFIVSTRPGLTSGTTDTCVFVAGDTLLFRFGDQLTTTIDRLPAKNNDIQIYTEMSCGAVRLEECDIVKVLIDNTKI